MRRWYIILLILVCTQSIYGQCSFGSFAAMISSNKDIPAGCLTEISSRNNLKDTSSQDSIRLLISNITKSRTTNKGYIEAVSTWLGDNPRTNHLIAESQYAFGLNNFLKKSYTEAIEHFRLALARWENSAYPDSSQMGKSHLNIGVCHYLLSEIDSAEYYLNKSLEKRWGIPLRNEANSYRTLGLLYKENGNFTQSEQYFLLAANTYKAAGRDSSDIAIKIIRELGKLNYKYENYEASESYARDAIGILSNSENPSALILAQADLARSLNMQKRFDESIQINNDILSKTPFNKKPQEYIRHSINLLGSYLDQRDVERSVTLLNNIDSLLVLQPNSRFESIAEMNWGQYYRKIGDYDRAIQTQERVLAKSCEITIDSLWLANPSDLKPELLKPTISTLMRLAVIYRDRYRSTENPSDIKLAMRIYQKVADILDAFKANQLNPKLTVNLGALNTDLLEEVLTLIDDLPDQPELFYSYFEKAKSASLLASIQLADIIEDRGLNFNEINKISQIEDSINALQLNSMNNSYDQEEQLEIDQNILSLNKELLSLQKELNKKIYSQTSLQTLYEHVNLSDLQRALATETAMISYFMAEETPFLYAMVITSDTVRLQKKQLYQSFESDIRFLIDASHTTTAHQDAWVTANRRVSNILLDSIWTDLPDRIIVLPDNILNYIPFEILLTENPSPTSEYHQFPYLIRDKIISYDFSASIWHAMVQKKNDGRGILTMAPDFSPDQSPHSEIDTTVSPLANNKDEIKLIKSIWNNGRSITPTNKEEFIFGAERASIIHFAGHAFLNDVDPDNSYLAFSRRKSIDHKLFIREVYNIRTQADMAVLSACKTGQGEIKKGEGAMSMTRAFAYAGTKSLIYSLWDVNDAATKSIMSDFYAGLKTGVPKDVALSDAKLSYLENSVGRTQHPYFWAGIIAMGDMSPLPNHTIAWYWYVLASILILTLIYIIFFQKPFRTEKATA